jgi:hypothetical protein
MSKQDTNPTPADAIRDFRNAAAAIFASWATLGTIGNSGLRDMLSYIGVDYYTACQTSAENVITVTAPDTDLASVVPSGTKPEQYTDTALAEFASDYLRNLRRTTHLRIKRHCQREYVTSDQAIAALSALGYAASAHPAVKSTAHATITDEFGNSFDVNWTQDGQLSEAEVRDGLESQFGTHPVAAGVMAAFPAAKAARLPKLISGVMVSSELTWPESDTTAD